MQIRVDFVLWFLSVIHRHKIPTWAFSSSPFSTPPVCFSLWSGCTGAPGMLINTAPGMLHCTQCSWEAAPVCRVQIRPGCGKPSGPDLSIVSISRLAETHLCNLILLPLKSAHGRQIHSPSVFHPDIRCRLEGLLGLAVHSGQRFPMSLLVFGSEPYFKDLLG